MAFKPMVQLKKGQTIGSPLKAPPQKMKPAAIAKRKRSTLSNAAGKVMGGLYSK